MSGSSRQVLVTGASGYIGGRLVPRLLLQGHKVVCLARDPSRLAGPQWAGTERVKGDASFETPSTVLYEAWTRRTTSCTRCTKASAVSSSAHLLARGRRHRHR